MAIDRNDIGLLYLKLHQARYLSRFKKNVGAHKYSFFDSGLADPWKFPFQIMRPTSKAVTPNFLGKFEAENWSLLLKNSSVTAECIQYSFSGLAS
jgi:hypothetical protein